jgi:hypothetical protein
MWRTYAEWPAPEQDKTTTTTTLAVLAAHKERTCDVARYQIRYNATKLTIFYLLIQTDGE